MKRILCPIAVILAIFLLFTALADTAADTIGSATVFSAEEIVSQMDTDEKIGQLLMPCIRTWKDSDDAEPQNVTVLNDAIRAIIADYHLGGIDLFSENCADISQLVHLTYDMQHAAIDAGNLPLLISTDQEGGNVSRAKFGTLFSGNMALGASGNAEYANIAGEIIGKELDALGVNCNIAPDADVNSNEWNPIIGIRAFSGDPDVASEMSVAMSKGFESSNVIGCAKHFPGHGDTSTDSHTGISSVNKSYEEWMASDGAPFRAVIQNKAASMIMTAHLQYPGLDDTTYYSPALGKDIVLPATMSKKILTDILRGDLGFDGVIATDAMNMGAIEKYFGINDAVIKSIDAGADIILMAVNPTCIADREKMDSLFRAIKAALADGRIGEARLNDAVTRIVKLKIDKGIIGKDYDFDPDAAAEAAKKIVGCPQHRAIEHDIALQCVDIVYEGQFEPFSPNENDTVVCIMTRPDDMYSAEHAIIKLEENGILPNVDAKYYNVEKYWADNEDKPLDPKMLRDAAEADYLIVGYYCSAEAVRNPNHKINLVFDEILEHAAADNTVILWERLPYGTEDYADRYPCVVLYNSAGMTQADIGKDTFTDQYGCAITAGFEIIFGVRPE